MCKELLDSCTILDRVLNFLILLFLCPIVSIICIFLALSVFALPFYGFFNPKAFYTKGE